MYITWRAVVAAGLGVPIAVFTAAGFNGALLWALVLTLVCVADAAAAPGTANVGLRRQPVGPVRLGESVRASLFAINAGTRRLRGHVRDSWPPSAGASTATHALDLPRGERAQFTILLTPTRRGDRVAGKVTVRLDGPLRLAGRQRSVDVPRTLRVLPEFASRRHLPSRLARLRELDGRSAVQIRGPGSEFDSLREYVIGDDVRAIDWRASARGQDLVVRTWRPERDRHVIIVVDSARTSAVRIGAEPRLDASIEATLLLSALAGHAGDRVQVIGFDREVRARVAASSGKAIMSTLADRLAPLESRLVEFDWSGATATVNEAISQRALVVFLTALEPSSVDAGMLRSLAPVARKHQVVVAAVDDPDIAELASAREGALDIYAAGAAERARIEREALMVRLRSGGIEVVTGAPDELAPRLADEYLALKAAGRL